MLQLALNVATTQIILRCNLTKFFQFENEKYGEGMITLITAPHTIFFAMLLQHFRHFFREDSLMFNVNAM